MESPAAVAQQVEPSLWLCRLRLSAFRCYAEAAIETDARPVVLTGPNGAGKTNLLEAVSLLAPGRGLRRAKLAELLRRRPASERSESDQGQSWAVAAEVVTLDGTRALGTGSDPAAAGEGGRDRRLVRIDGAPARSQQALSEIVSAVWLTPQMDGLFREGPGARRRFLDRLVYAFDPAHAGRISAYEQALRERARLLKTAPREASWLAALEQALAEKAVAIGAARRDMTARLADACAAAIGPFPRAGLGLLGDVERWLGEMPALAAEESLRQSLAASRAQDAESGGAAHGPHRSDLAVRHLGKGQEAALCSTGEQKALLIAIVLAHARLLLLEHGRAPLLLLDEVAAHLDGARRDALFAEILALGLQAWMTGTDENLFSGLGSAAQFFTVRDAALAPAA
jgi:DNA replication and repair protein RecF